MAERSKPRSGREPQHWSGLPPGAIRCLNRRPPRAIWPNPGASCQWSPARVTRLSCS